MRNKTFHLGDFTFFSRFTLFCLWISRAKQGYQLIEKFHDVLNVTVSQLYTCLSLFLFLTIVCKMS